MVFWERFEPFISTIEPSAPGGNVRIYIENVLLPAKLESETVCVDAVTRTSYVTGGQRERVGATWPQDVRAQTHTHTRRRDAMMQPRVSRRA